MDEAKRRERNNEELIQGMKQYIDKLRDLSPEQAKHEAYEDLLCAGVIDENGKTKENIVTWAQGI